jgi:hypothetical protein
MGIQKSPWAASLFLEANKFWFYSLVLSILLGIIQLCNLGINPPLSEEKNKDISEEQADLELKGWKVNRSKIMRRLVIDGCDVFIPGFVTGWIVVSSAGVGLASVVSTVLASMDIWERVQGSP